MLKKYLQYLSPFQNWINKNFNVIGLTIILILSYIIKVATLPDLTIYGDESFSVFHAQKSLQELLAILKTDRNPPLYFTALHYWIKWSGIHVVQVKALSVLFSILTSVFLFLLSVKYFNKLTALFASIMFLFSDVHYEYSHEVRAYALVMLLVTISFYLFLNLIKKPSYINIILLSVVNAGLMYSHYITVFYIFSQVLVAIYYCTQQKSLLKPLLITYISTLVLFGPWINVVLQNVPKASDFWLGIPGWPELKYVFGKLAEDPDLENFYIGVAVLSLPLALFNGKLKFLNQSFNLKKYLLLASWFIIPIITCYLVAQFTPIFRDKYVIASSLGWILLVGYSISSFRVHWIIRLCMISPFFIFTINNFYPEDRGIENWKETARVVQNIKRERTLTVLTAGYKYIDFCFYYNKSYFKDYNNTENLLFEKDDIYPLYTDIDFEIVDWSKYDYVILVESHEFVVDKDTTVRKYLEKKFQTCKQYGSSKTNKITLFSIPEMYCQNFADQGSYPADKSKCEFWDLEVLTNDIQKTEINNFSTDLENLTHCSDVWQLSFEQANSGRYSNKVNSENEYSITLNEHVEGLMEIDLDMKAYLNEACNGIYVVSLEDNGKPVFREEVYFDNVIKKYGGWEDVSFSFTVPPEDWGKHELKTYLWNNNECAIYLDDIKVSLHVAQ